MLNLFRNRRRYMNNFDKFDINRNQLEQLKNKGAIIVDVRSPQEFNEGHINNSISIPEYELEQKAPLILKEPDNTIVVYCSSGARSKRAQKTLNEMGYKNVFNLYGGLGN